MIYDEKTHFYVYNHTTATHLLQMYLSYFLAKIVEFVLYGDLYQEKQP
ncbi:hypothetical protein BCI9360_03208 [Bacillus sp. CECT 9360]|nr:hypothetical protein BCI9360_03208 [Bacillus sp. CECT 9360]